MRISQLIFALYPFLAASMPAQVVSTFADAPHVHVQLMVLQQGLNRGQAAEAGLYFKLDPGWHVYWKNAGDAGEPPHAQWTLPEGITAGAMQFPAPKRLPLGPLMDYGYLNEVLFPLTLNVAGTAKPGPQMLHAKVDWLVCQSSCIPGRAELEISREVYEHPVKSSSSASDAAIFKRFIDELPKAPPPGYKIAFQPSRDALRLFVATGQNETHAAFFPADQGILDNPAPQKLTPTPTGLILDLKKQANLTANPAQLSGVLELSGGRAFAIAALPGKVAMGGSSTSHPSASSTAVIAPSASPAIASSAPSIVPPLSQSALVAVQPPAQFTWLGFVRIELFAFVGGLILNLMPCVFPVLFLKGLALVNSRNEERRQMRAHGFVYTSGVLLSFWVLVAVLLGLRFAGAKLGWGFQFQSPVFLALMAGLLFFLGLSLAGQFEIGLTLTSTGGSLAAKQGYTGSFFTGVLAVVVATPCTAPFMGTAIGYALAQPAAVTFAVFTALALGLAAPYVALTLHPAWTRLLPRPGSWMEVLKQAISIPIFATVIWLAWVLAQAYGASVLAALLASFLLLAIAGWFLGRWPAKRWASAVAAVILLGVIALSVFAPRKLIAPSGAMAQTETYGGWEPWSVEAVSRYLSQGRPVFVDFTASWCLSCQVNERAALNRPEVQKAFADANVILLRADWTRHDEAITQALAGLGRSGVPAYVMYTPGERYPELLPEVLTPGIVTDALSKLPKVAELQDPVAPIAASDSVKK
ncbi:MAG: thioredoxin family protein [Terracidiphilus sp.]